MLDFTLRNLDGFGKPIRNHFDLRKRKCAAAIARAKRRTQVLVVARMLLGRIDFMRDLGIHARDARQQQKINR